MVNVKLIFYYVLWRILITNINNRAEKSKRTGKKSMNTVLRDGYAIVMVVFTDFRCAMNSSWFNGEI